MTTLLNRFMANESGATSIEYGMLAALIFLACVATWKSLSSELDTKYGKVKDCVNNAASC